jgi:hypothetical protein
MNIPSPKNGLGAAGFRAGPSAAKNSIQQISIAKSAQANKTSESNNSTNNNSGEIAKSEANQAQAYTRPGQTAKSSKDIGRNSRSQDILNQMRNGRKKDGRLPGSAYNDINGARSAANEAAAWQANIKGSEATAKALADGFKAMGQGLGALGSTLAKGIEKKVAESKGGGDQSSGGAQSSGGNQQVAQQEQQAAQQQQFAQNDIAQGGSAQNA